MYVLYFQSVSASSAYKQSQQEKLLQTCLELLSADSSTSLARGCTWQGVTSLLVVTCCSVQGLTGGHGDLQQRGAQVADGH